MAKSSFHETYSQYNIEKFSFYAFKKQMLLF